MRNLEKLSRRILNASGKPFSPIDGPTAKKAGGSLLA
jgi:hypothetical protein